MTILVIGGPGGMVAGALAKHDGVVAVGRPDADLAQPQTLEATLTAHAPRLVICAGAFTQVDRAESAIEHAMCVNADGPGALARYCAARAIPLIHLSTDYVFDGAKPAAYVETDAPAPINAYGRSKLAGECAVAAAGGRHVIVRTSWVYAEAGTNFVRTMLRLAGTKDRIGVVDDQHGSPTYASHLAEALLAIAHRLLRDDDPALLGIVHTCASGDCTWRAFAETIFAGSHARGGPHAQVDAITNAQFSTPARRPANSRLDCTRLRQAFGVTLPDWPSGLDACLDAIAADGWRID